MNKRLVYYWFVPCKSSNSCFSNTNTRNSCDINRFEQLHLNCLKHYSNVFDSAVILLSVEDGAAIEDVQFVREKLLQCGFNKLEILVCSNNSFLCECEFWKQYVIENCEDFDGITFYYQTKGITHKFSNSMVDWATALYFFNLNNEPLLSNKNEYVSSGAFFYDRPNGDYIYSGNAYWVNHNNIKKWYEINGGSPNDYNLVNRFAAEDYFFRTFPPHLSLPIGKPVMSCDDYNDCQGHIFSSFETEQIKQYMDFKYNIALKGITL